MRTIARTLFVITLLTLAVAAQSAQKKPSFSGRWTSVSPKDSAGQVQVVTQDEKTLAIEELSKGGSRKMTYQLDGVERRLAIPGRGADISMLAKASWDGDHIVITTNTSYPNGMKTQAKEVWSIDAEGRLVIDYAESGPTGPGSERAAHLREAVMPLSRAYEYWIPMLVFAVITVADSKVPPAWFPALYILKAAAVTASLLYWRAPLREIRIDRKMILPSVLLGLVVCVLWIGIDTAVPYPHLGSRGAFDPTPLLGSLWGITFLVVRLYGLVVMVPVMEELFWRSFLLRYLTDPDFHKVPLGTFSALSLWLMVAASALAHPEWLVAIVASLAYALWLRRTKNLFGAIVAHATTNAALGVYVLVTGSWQYW